MEVENSTLRAARKLVEEVRRVLLAFAAALGMSEDELARLERVFLTAARYEYLFREMAYRREQWPV